jgi:SOS-response transcriptional repressor LexA
MAPTITDGTIIGVDCAQYAISQLSGAFIVVQSPGKGAIVRRLSVFGTLRVLFPENQAYDMIPYAGEPWKIVGKVVFWIGYTPPVRK